MGVISDQELRDRVIAAALACVARWGIGKTTLEDVAREAGCSRATIYRTFRGGKAEVLAATLHAELDRLRAAIDAAADGAGDDLADVAVAAVVTTARFLAGHDALAHLLAHEPDALAPLFTFRRLGQVFAMAGVVAEPHLARFVADPEERRLAAEWLLRVVLTYVLNPSEHVDLTVEADARRLLVTYVLPSFPTRTLQEKP